MMFKDRENYLKVQKKKGLGSLQAPSSHKNYEKTTHPWVQIYNIIYF